MGRTLKVQQRECTERTVKVGHFNRAILVDGVGDAE